MFREFANTDVFGPCRVADDLAETKSELHAARADGLADAAELQNRQTQHVGWKNLDEFSSTRNTALSLPLSRLASEYLFKPIHRVPDSISTGSVS